MRRCLPLALCVLALCQVGCTEKSELRALCGTPKVGERQYTVPAIARAAGRLRQAEESEEIAADLDRRRLLAIKRRQAMYDEIGVERAEAEAMSLDDKNARRKAILEVTAKEMEAQKVAEETTHYELDIERNLAAAKGHREAAGRALASLLAAHGLTEAGRARLAGPPPPTAAAAP